MTGIINMLVGALPFFDLNPLFFVINIIFMLTAGLVAENNFRSMKLFIIMLTCGILNAILIGIFNVYMCIVPIIGVLLYMRYRAGDIFSKAKYIHIIIVIYVFFLIVYGVYIGAVFVMEPIAGIIPGFCTAGILGFEGDIIDSNLKKRLSLILLIYVLAVALKRILIF